LGDLIRRLNYESHYATIEHMNTAYTPDEIEALHRKYAPSDEVYDLVFTHCLVVRDIAMQLIAKGAFKVNVELVMVGCMLHDIGVYPLFGVDGA